MSRAVYTRYFDLTTWLVWTNSNKILSLSFWFLQSCSQFAPLEESSPNRQYYMRALWRLYWLDERIYGAVLPPHKGWSNFRLVRTVQICGTLCSRPHVFLVRGNLNTCLPVKFEGVGWNESPRVRSLLVTAQLVLQVVSNVVLYACIWNGEMTKFILTNSFLMDKTIFRPGNAITREKKRVWGPGTPDCGNSGLGNDIPMRSHPL